MSINIISASPVDESLQRALATGAVASAEALQAETQVRHTRPCPTHGVLFEQNQIKSVGTSFFKRRTVRTVPRHLNARRFLLLL